MSLRRRRSRKLYEARSEEAAIVGVDVEDVIAYDRAAAASGHITRRGLRHLPSRKLAAPSPEPTPYEGDYDYSAPGFDIIGGVACAVTCDMWPPVPEADDDLIDIDPEDDSDAEQDANEDPPKCPDCKGTGWYVGFQAREMCETCGGSGY